MKMPPHPTPPPTPYSSITTVIYCSAGRTRMPADTCVRGRACGCLLCLTASSSERDEWGSLWQRSENSRLSPAGRAQQPIQVVSLFLSAHGFISISTAGPITAHQLSLFLIFCLARRGAPARFWKSGRLLPIALCHPRGPPGPGNGRQKCDDRTL